MSFSGDDDNPARSAWTLIAVIFIAVCLAIGCVSMLQEQLIFFPEHLDEDTDLGFTAADEEVFVDTDDGARIHGLLYEADAESDWVVLYFHGNAGSVASWYQVGLRLKRHELDVFLIDYRTYGKSTGEMSEEGIYLDAKASYEELLHRGYDAESILVYGRSLGSGPATWLATEYPVGALALETPFVDLPTLAGDLYKIPVPNWLLQYRFDNASRAENIDVPTWIVHGSDDRIVPAEHGFRLSRQLPNVWQMTLIEGGRHNDLMSFSEYDRALEGFLDEIGAGGPD